MTDQAVRSGIEGLPERFADFDHEHHTRRAIELARRAVREFSPEERMETAMYTSTEPCPMCAGGIYHGGLPAVVYSVSAERAGELGTDLVVPSSEVFAGGAHEVAVAGPVCPDEGERLCR
jgi:tRNA(Arg) A34 adenosine deaminase TadA